MEIREYKFFRIIFWVKNMKSNMFSSMSRKVLPRPRYGEEYSNSSWSGGEMDKPFIFREMKRLGISKTEIRSFAECRKFYKTSEWIDVRDKYLTSISDKQCAHCKIKDVEGVRLLVDHKQPIKYFWKNRLNELNFQILCGLCNKKKGNTYSEKDVPLIGLKIKKIMRKGDDK